MLKNVLALIVMVVTMTVGLSAPVQVVNAQEPTPECSVELYIDQVFEWLNRQFVFMNNEGSLELSFINAVGNKVAINLPRNPESGNRLCLNEVEGRNLFTFLLEMTVDNMTEPPAKLIYFCYDLEVVRQWTMDNQATLRFWPDTNNPTSISINWVDQNVENQLVVLEGKYGGGNLYFCVKPDFLPYAIPVLGNPELSLEFDQ